MDWSNYIKPGRFAKVMLAMRYRQSQADYALFIKKLDSRLVTALFVYITVTWNNENEKLAPKQYLKKEF